MSPHHSAISHSGGPSLLAYVIGLKGACVSLDLLFGIYRIAGKFGGDFNLEVWRIVRTSPNLNSRQI